MITTEQVPEGAKWSDSYHGQRLADYDEYRWRFDSTGKCIFHGRYVKDTTAMSGWRLVENLTNG